MSQQKPPAPAPVPDKDRFESDFERIFKGK